MSRERKERKEPQDEPKKKPRKEAKPRKATVWALPAEGWQLLLLPLWAPCLSSGLLCLQLLNDAGDYLPRLPSMVTSLRSLGATFLRVYFHPLTGQLRIVCPDIRGAVWKTTNAGYQFDKYL